VRDHNQHALISRQKILEPMDRVEIQVVRRLVKQERLRISKQRLRQQHPDFLSALQLAHFSLVQFIGDVEALKQNGSVAFGGVAVFLADDSFQLAELHAISIGDFRLGINAVALLSGRPQALVAHNDGVDCAITIKGKLVLAQDADLLRVDDRALLRLDLAGQKLHESGFARAVRPGQAIAFARRKGG